MKRSDLWILSALMLSFTAPMFGTASPAAAVDAVPKAAAPAPDLTGLWEVSVGPPDTAIKSKLRLNRDGDGWKGSYILPDGTDLPVTARLSGSQVTLEASFTDPNGTAVKHTDTFTLDGDTMKGSVKFGDRPEMAFLATRTHVGAQKPAGPLGDWTISVMAPNQVYTSTLSLKRDGDRVGGEMTGDQGFHEALKSASTTGGDVKFSVDIPINGSPVTFDYAGTVDGDSMKGTVHSQFGDLPFTGKRKGAPAGAATGSEKGLAGDWLLSFGTPGGPRAAEASFKRDGDLLTGTITRGRNGGSVPLKEVSETGSTAKFSIEFTGQAGTPIRVDYTGKIDGDDMTGTAHSSRGDRPFTARRKSAGPKSYAGVWSFTLTAPDKTYTPEITFAQTGETLTGSMQGPGAGLPLEEGTAANGAIHFFVKIPIQGKETRVEFIGKADGDHLAGQARTDAWSIPWTADRKKAGGAK